MDLTYAHFEVMWPMLCQKRITVGKKNICEIDGRALYTETIILLLFNDHYLICCC